MKKVAVRSRGDKQRRRVGAVPIASPMRHTKKMNGVKLIDVVKPQKPSWKGFWFVVGALVMAAWSG